MGITKNPAAADNIRQTSVGLELRKENETEVYSAVFGFLAIMG